MTQRAYTPFYRKPINWIVLVGTTIAGMSFTMAYLEYDRTQKLSESRRASYDFLRQAEKEHAESRAALKKYLEPDKEAAAKTQATVDRLLANPR